MDARNAGSGTIQNCKQQFPRNYCFQNDHYGILKNGEIELTDKTQASDPTKRQYYWIRILNYKLGTKRFKPWWFQSWTWLLVFHFKVVWSHF